MTFNVSRWVRMLGTDPGPRVGVAGHDGDCHIYNIHAHICTCGLLHALQRYPDKAPALYTLYGLDMARQDLAFGALRMLLEKEES